MAKQKNVIGRIFEPPCFPDALYIIYLQRNFEFSRKSYCRETPFSLCFLQLLSLSFVQRRPYALSPPLNFSMVSKLGAGPLPQYWREGCGQVGQGRLCLLHHYHALWRRLRIHRPHCPGKAVAWHPKDQWKQVILLPAVSITIMLYGSGCVFIVLIAQVEESRDILKTNGNRLFYSLLSPSLSRSTEVAAYSSSSLPR